MGELGDELVGGLVAWWLLFWLVDGLVSDGWVSGCFLGGLDCWLVVARLVDGWMDRLVGWCMGWLVC